MILKRSSIFFGLALSVPGTAFADDTPNTPPIATASPLFPIPSGITAITITTGGGGKIAERDTGFLKPPKGWRMHYVANPAAADTVNQLLAAEGHDVMSDDSVITPCQRCWIVEDVYTGPVSGYAVLDATDETRATVNRRVAETIFAVALAAVVGAGTRGHVDNVLVPGPRTERWGRSKHITMEMLEGLPPDASKMLVTRVSNPGYQARQEVLTLAYGDASDDEIRKINTRYLVGMLALKGAPDVSTEEYDGKPFGREAPTTYVTGSIPAAEQRLDAVVTHASEINVAVPVTKGAGNVNAEFGNPPSEASVPAWEITYRVDGEAADRSTIVLKRLLPEVSVGDRIKLQRGLFRTTVYRIS